MIQYIVFSEKTISENTQYFYAGSCNLNLAYIVSYLT